MRKGKEASRKEKDKKKKKREEGSKKEGEKGRKPEERRIPSPFCKEKTPMIREPFSIRETGK